jgi:predicted esterase
VAGIEARTLPAQVHGRYLLEIPAGAGPHALLVGFHGYGERAEQHLEKLRLLPGAEGWARVAVQSLHLFYTRGGEVVGSWMTKLDRELAIPDNEAYAAAVVARVRAEAPAVSGPLVYVGFSQGASMAWRAAAHSGHACAGIIALGGDMPPDVADDPAARLPPARVARGRKDEWFTREKMDRDLERLRARGVRVSSLEFDGGHEWGEEFFAAAGEFLRGASKQDQ